MLSEKQIGGSINETLIFVFTINQWRVRANTLCWRVLERSLNSSCSEADPHLCIPSAGRSTAGKQNWRRALDTNTTTSVCSVAEFHLEVFFIFFFVWLLTYVPEFSVCFHHHEIQKPLWKVGKLESKKKKLMRDLIARRCLHYSCRPLSITSRDIPYNESWASACFPLKLPFPLFFLFLISDLSFPNPQASWK